MTAVGVLIVHHEEGSRRAARAVVSATPALEPVSEAATAEEALELAVALRPGLALVGTVMPGIDGFEASRRLMAALPGSTVVLLYSAAEPDADALAESQAAGALHLDELTPASLQAFGEGLQSG
jgi:two-component system invasion response regulator UvrY